MANTNQNAREAGALPTFGAEAIGSTGNSSYAVSQDRSGEIWGGALTKASAQFGDWAQQSAKADAEAAGKIAGLDPNYRPDDLPRLQAAAYHAAAIKTYQNQLETKSRAAVDKAYNDFTNLPVEQQQPAAFAKALADAKAGLLKADVFDEVRPSFEKGFDDLSASYARAVQRDADRRQIDTAQAATLANASQIGDTAHRLASLTTASDKDIAAQLDAHAKLLDDAVSNGQMTAVAAQAMKEKFKQSVAQTRALALFDNLPDSEKPAAAARFKAAYGSGDYRAFVAQKESGNNPNARADVGTASGLYQFTDDTWKAVMRAHPDLGLTLAGKNDVAQQNRAFDALTADNGAALQAAGFDATPGNLYMAHFLGAGGATKFLAALDKNPNASAASLFPKEAAANPAVFTGKTLREVYNSQTKGLSGPQTAGLSNDSYDWLAGQMERRVASVQADATRAQKAALNEIGAAKKQIADGFDVPQAQWSQLQQQYAASPDETVRGAFEQADRVRTMLAGFVGKRPEQIEAAVTNLRASLKDGADPRQVELVKDAESWLSSYRQDIAKDPVGRYARDFGAKVLALDFSSGQSLAASLQARAPVADQAAAAYGLPARRLLLPDDKAAFKTLAANGGPQMIAAAAATMKALGPQGGELLREIGDAAPAFVTAGRVAAQGGDPEFLRDFAEWNRLSSDPATKKSLELPNPKAAHAELDKAFGHALTALPDLALSARTAATQTFEVRALRNGFDKTLTDPAARDELQRTAQQALGATYDGRVQYGGVADRSLGWFSGSEKLLAPGNMRADRVGSAIASLTDDDLKALPSPPVYADNRPVPARVIAGSRLVSVGRGKYQIADGDPLTPGTTFLNAAGGGRFTLDLNALEDRLRARLPGAYR